MMYHWKKLNSGNYHQLAFRKLNEEIRSQLYGMCPLIHRNKPAYVIIAGSEVNKTFKSDHPIITYRNPRSALVFSHSSATLNARGETNVLKKGTSYFIPEDVPALRRKKVIQTATAAALIIVLAFMSLLAIDSGTSEDGFPSQYLVQELKLTEETLFASNGELGENEYAQLLDQEIREHLDDAGYPNDHFRDERMISYCDLVLKDKRPKVETKELAFIRLRDSAFCNRKPEIILIYENHPLDAIKDLVKKTKRSNWGKFGIAGIDVLPRKRSEIPSDYLDLTLSLPEKAVLDEAGIHEGGDSDSQKNAWIYHLIVRAIRNDYWMNQEIIPFCEAVLKESGLRAKTKNKALTVLLDSACLNKMPDLLLYYRNHQDLKIRDHVEDYMRRRPDRKAMSGLK